MSHLPASHYLKIYRLRQSMAERGVTRPEPRVLHQICALVEELEKMSPTSEIRLELPAGKVNFVEVSTSRVFGTIVYPEKNE